MPFLGLLTAGLVLCGMLTDPLLAAEVDCTGVEGAFKGQAALAFSTTMGAPNEIRRIDGAADGRATATTAERVD